MRMLSVERRIWLREQASRYSDALDANPDVSAYLLGELRGLEWSTVGGALLGVVTEPEAEHRDYTGRISIPYITPGGVVGLRFRCAGPAYDPEHKCEGHAKYLSVTGAPVGMYNVKALHDAGDVIGIAEGEFDALAATQAGLPTVGIPGVQTWKPHWYRLFEGFSEVIMLQDGDDAGEGLASVIQEEVEATRICAMPGGEDVSSFIVAKGPEEFMNWVR